MPETVHVKNMGLRGVTVADTKISFIDGENGILLYRGYRIEQLAESSTFMETAYLILNGALPMMRPFRNSRTRSKRPGPCRTT